MSQAMLTSRCANADACVSCVTRLRVSVAIFDRPGFDELWALDLGALMRRQICKRPASAAMALRDLDHISLCGGGIVSGSSQPAEKRGDFTCAGQF
jgi:hypothetical protein